MQSGTPATERPGGAAIVHIADVLEDDGYFRTEPSTRALVDASGMRTALTVALRKDEVLLGALTVYRQEIRPFSDQQIALFADSCRIFATPRSSSKASSLGIEATVVAGPGIS